MKTFLACLVFAAIGSAIAWNINHQRYGHYEAYLGPIDYEGQVTAVNAVASLREGWSNKFPKVELPDGNVYDFGVMSPGEEGEHVFVVKNVGEEALTLKVGASTCKCTVGELGAETVAPGEQTEVTMSWTVKTNESSFGQSAELRTNDPSQVAIRLEIRGQVVREVQLVPEQVTFGEVAAGENVEVEVKVFSYIEDTLRPGEVKFSDDEVNQLTEFEVTPMTPSEEDGVNQAAKQAFVVKAKIAPGLKQGPVNENLVFELLPEDAAASADTQVSKEDQDDPKSDPADSATPTSDQRYVHIPVTGRIVGALSMLPNSRLTGVSGGGYIFDFGKVESDDDLTAKSFVVLKGSEQSATNLSIGEVSPAEHIEASLANPIGKGSMTLYSLQLKLKPGDEKVDRLGMSKDDYGFVMIESDNPKVPALKLRLKFALPAR